MKKLSYHFNQEKNLGKSNYNEKMHYILLHLFASPEMRRLKPISVNIRSFAVIEIRALAALFACLPTFADENASAHEAVPAVPPHYIEAPFRLDDADQIGLPAYDRFLSKPPLFYPRAANIFSWIDSAKSNWHSLQDLIDRPDLAHEVFPKLKDKDMGSDLLVAPGFSRNILDETENSEDQDAVDQYIARLTAEASNSVDENALKARMLVNPPSEEDLRKGIAFLESLRSEGQAESIISPPAPSPLNLPIPDLPNPDSASLPSAVSPQALSTPQVLIEPPVSPLVAVPSNDQVLPDQGTLRVAAKVPLPDGSQRPAFASEFFLTTRQLEDLLTEAIPYPSAANDVRQLIRLWAESEKRAGGKGVKLALNVKSVLIKAQVSKVLTDFKGEAELAGLKPDDYYLIGIDKDDETGIVTIWSKPIAVGRGENLVELSLQDVVWNK